MNAMYDIAVNAMIEGTLDLAADDLWVRAFAGTSYDSWITTVDDVVGAIPGMTDQQLIDRNVFNRSMTASDITFPQLPENVVLTTLVAYRADDGLPVFYLDTRPDRMQLNVTGNGGPITVAWANGLVVAL